jgi:hypothetical protein
MSALTGFGIWYGTPVSSWVTTFLVYQIPVEADVLLGKAALIKFEYKTIHHPYWTPLVKQVGQELIATLEASSKEVMEEACGDRDPLGQTFWVFWTNFQDHEVTVPPNPQT